MEIAKLTGGIELKDVIKGLLDSIDLDRNIETARKQFGLAPDAEPTDQHLDEVEEEAQRAALKPFHNPVLRELILKIKSDLEQVIDEVTQDELQDATPFAAMGGLGKVYQLFGEGLPKMLEDLNEGLAA